jgi:hypothetical protein
LSPDVREHEGTTATPAAPPPDPRAEAVERLFALVQRGRGHVAVIGPSAEVAAALFGEAEARLAVHRGVRLRGASLDEAAALAALCADKEDADGRVGHAMRTLVQEARAAGLPVVVVVTEADLADLARLERLRERLEWVPGAAEVTRLVLLGGPKLATMLRRREARGFGSLVAATVRVPEATAAGTGSARLARLLASVGAAAAVALAALALWTRPAPTPEGPPPVETPTAAPSAPPSPPTAPAAIPTVPATTPAPAPIAAEAPVDAPPGAQAAPTLAEIVPTPEPTVPPATAPPAPPPPAAARPEASPLGPRAASGPTIQVGAFTRVENAEALRAKLAPRFPGVHVSAIGRGGTTYHRVRIGGFASAAELDAAVAALRRAGYAPARVRD